MEETFASFSKRKKMKKITKFGVKLIRLLYSDRMALIQIILGLVSIAFGLWLGKRPEYVNITVGCILILMGTYQLICNKIKRRKQMHRQRT
ncbi:hypothetical protein GCM10027566_15150 [Arachidicoccus ginsenosidivorans]|jgi:hypothetical protein|uniref:Uncharacterized protein n=2 Tax=Arachidicoccus ginsenosidivorans TaxID=496057 RepID=A0A5B8VJ17_9BACT|nr:hypothetical protein FSB73_04230 [Arachidicoccus ginsenosidivorans]